MSGAQVTRASPSGGSGGWPTTFPAVTATGNSTANTTEIVNATSGAITRTLPASPATGALVGTYRGDSSSNVLTYQASGGGTIDGNPTATLSAQTALLFQHTGSNVWIVVSEAFPAGALYYQTLQIGGANKTQRGHLNLIAGTGVTITEADNSGADSSDVTIAATGGGGVAAAAVGSPLLITASPYNAKCDAKRVHDAAITSGQNTLSSASASFTSADIGKVVLVNDAGGTNTPLMGWITSVSGGVATLMTTQGGATPANAAATVSGAIAWYGTDDTAAYRALITAIYNANGLAHGFVPGISMIAGALQHSSTDGPDTATFNNTYNAQIPLPAVRADGSTGKPVRVIQLVGPAPRSSFEPGGPADDTLCGAGLISTLTGQAWDATYKWPSMIAGTSTLTDSVWHAVRPELINLSLINPQNPTIRLADFTQCVTAAAEGCTFRSTLMINSPTFPVPTNPSGGGLFMPGKDCYVGSRVQDCIFGGQYGAFRPGEHTKFDQVYFYFNVVPFVLGVMTHPAQGGYVCVEACKHVIASLDSGTAGALAATAYLNIDCLDMELGGSGQYAGWATTDVVWDNNHGLGEIGYVFTNGTFTLTGATTFHLRNLARQWTAITPGTNCTSYNANAIIDGEGVIRLTGAFTVTGAIAQGATIGTLPAGVVNTNSDKYPPIAVSLTTGAAFQGACLKIAQNSTTILYQGPAISSGGVISLETSFPTSP